MDPKKRAKLEARGYQVGDAADFLEMNDEERVLLDFRMTITKQIRLMRQELGLTQKEAADRMKTTQPRFAKIEAYATDVSLDQLLRAYLVLGGTMSKLFKGFTKTHQDHLEISGKPTGKAVAKTTPKDAVPVNLAAKPQAKSAASKTRLTVPIKAKSRSGQDV